MDIKSQVVNLKLSKRMDELGFKRESVWWWAGGRLRITDNRKTSKAYWYNKGKNIAIPARTVAEILNVLPCYLDNKNFALTIQKTPDGFMVSYLDGDWNTFDRSTIDEDKEAYTYNKNLANALALMSIHLREEGLL